MNTIEIRSATNAEDFLDARQLIMEYVAWLGFDLAFQNFDQEMADLSAMYNAKDGGLFIAYQNRKPVGVAGLRRFSDTEAEVKRMFVQDEAQGTGIGKLLLQQCIESAKILNYKSIKLDTAAFMHAAIKLYVNHGFVEIPAYRFNPHDHARYFELVLTH